MKERERDREGRFYHHCDKTTLLAGEKATKEEISPSSIRILGFSIPPFIRVRICESVRVCTRVRISRVYTIYDFLEGARIWEHVQPVYCTCSHIARCFVLTANFNDRYKCREAAVFSFCYLREYQRKARRWERKINSFTLTLICLQIESNTVWKNSVYLLLM